jgi:kynureninase
MNDIEKFEPVLSFAEKMDAQDPLAHFRDEFHFPKNEKGEDYLYLCGNSLGLQPKNTASYVKEVLDSWAQYGVEGHLKGSYPWLPYHEFLTEKMAAIVGAKPIEVVVMNSLTVNLHLLMASFYRPTAERFKIVIEGDAFPSDQYAVTSQLKYHHIDPRDGLIRLRSKGATEYIRTEEILQVLEEEGHQIALVMLSGVNYYTGQAFDIKKITEKGKSIGAVVGWDLAHAAGNIALSLHEEGPDFAAWCTYKYLNSGPGSLSGVFVHQRHAHNFDLPRWAGWWGHNKQSRFTMPDEFEPIPGAEGWQLSNPPILSMAAIRASLDVFEKAGMSRLREKSKLLTGYLEFLLKELAGDKIEIITPGNAEQRGCQLSLRIPNENKSIVDRFEKGGIIVDWREPDVMRVAPTPIYNSFKDVYRFVEILKNIL